MGAFLWTIRCTMAVRMAQLVDVLMLMVMMVMMLGLGRNVGRTLNQRLWIMVKADHRRGVRAGWTGFSVMAKTR